MCLYIYLYIYCLIYCIYIYIHLFTSFSTCFISQKTSFDSPNQPIGQQKIHGRLEPSVRRSVGRTPFLGTRQDLASAQRAFCSWSDPLAAAKAVLQYDNLMAKDPTATWAWNAYEMEGKREMGDGMGLVNFTRFFFGGGGSNNVYKYMVFSKDFRHNSALLGLVI